MEGARANAMAFGAWGAKLPGVVLTALLIPAGRYVLGRMNAVKDALIDARKRHAEAGAAARAARKEAEEEAAGRAEAEHQTKEVAEKEAAVKHAPAEEQGAPAKTQKTLLSPAGEYVLGRVNAVKDALIDARKRHAEAGAAARVARKAIEEEAARRAEAERQTKDAAEKEAALKPASAEEQEASAQLKKKKKAKAKEDSLEV